MNEEEKKDIEYLKKYIKWETYGERSLETAIATILNLFEKQQKEIEELESRIDLGLDFRNEEIDKYMQENYISKDKIREYKEALKWKRQQEIENLGMSMLGSAIDVLEKLLGEKDDTKI